MSKYIHHLCDMLVELVEAYDVRSGAALGAAAVVSVTLRNAAGEAVEGADGLAAPHKAGTSGTYQAIIPRTVELIDGDTYYIELTVVSADGTAHGFYRWPVVATYQGV